jgi:hypothetical protein
MIRNRRNDIGDLSAKPQFNAVLLYIFVAYN